MLDLNMATIFSIIMAALCFVMFAVILVAALRMKPYTDPDTLKYFEPGFLAAALQYNRTGAAFIISRKVPFMGFYDRIFDYNMEDSFYRE